MLKAYFTKSMLNIDVLTFPLSPLPQTGRGDRGMKRCKCTQLRMKLYLKLLDYRIIPKHSNANITE